MAQAERGRSWLIGLCVLALAAGCRQTEPEAEPAQSPSPAIAIPAEPALPMERHTSPAPVEPAKPASPDPVIAERVAADQLLRAYASALEQGRWQQAAQAWRASSGVTAETLQASYDRGQSLKVTLGTGRVEGGAGSLYYEVPVRLRFGNDAPQEGTLTLRRVNDVAGSTREQREWRIERSTIGAGR